MTATARRIDAHVHFWALARADYDWMTPDLTTLYRDFGPQDLAPDLAAAGMGEVVLVQAAATVAETEFLLDIAEHTDFVSGVVGWVDMESSDAGSVLARLTQDRYFKGVRPMIQDISDTGWIARDSLRPALELIEKQQLCFDCLVKPQHLGYLHEMLVRHPGLRAVIDHGAKPQIGAGGIDGWAADMARIAAETSAYCKLSGLVTEASDHWSTEMLRPYTDHLLSVFGPRRLMFGSDWPVLTLAASYDEWFAAADSLLAGLSRSERDGVLGENAARFYRL